MLRPLFESDLAEILETTSGLWASLRGARLFVTGGTGFFGKWLLESFVYANRQLSLNATMVVLSRNPALFLQHHPHYQNFSEVTFHQGDVCNFSFPNGPFSHIIHAATPASASFNSKDPLGMYETIVSGTAHTLRFAAHAKIDTFLFASSGAVYGEQPLDLYGVDEDYFDQVNNPAQLTSPYAFGKWSAEKLLHLSNSPFSIKIARGFAFVGPHLPLDTHFAIGNFIRDAYNGDAILISGNPNAYRSYLYASDLTSALWTILCKGEDRIAYNVGAEEAITIYELACAVSACFDSKVQVKLAPSANALLPAYRYVPTSKRYHTLTQKNDISLPEAIQRTISWYYS